MAKKTCVRRLPPCPDYDVENRQTWLEDMAREGLVLTGFGRVWVQFKRTVPREIRYRLQPLLHKQGPAQAAIDLAAEYGWIHLGNHGNFAIFGTEDPEARELDTDPRIQAIAVEQLLKRRIRGHLIRFLLFLPVLWLILWAGPLVWLTKFTLWSSWGLALAIPAGLWLSAAELWHLGRLIRQLKLGQPLSQAKDWRTGQTRHKITVLCTTVLVYAVWVGVLLNNQFPWETFRWQPVTEPLPFADLTEAAGGGTYDVGNWVMDHNNEAAVRSTLLMREQIKFQQYGYVHREGQDTRNLWYTVDYYDMRTQWLAEALFDQLKSYDQRIHHYLAEQEDLPLSDLPTEQEHLYQTIRPTLLLQDGTRVLRVEFSQIGTSYLTAEQWTTTIANAFVG